MFKWIHLSRHQPTNRSRFVERGVFDNSSHLPPGVVSNRRHMPNKLNPPEPAEISRNTAAAVPHIASSDVLFHIVTAAEGQLSTIFSWKLGKLINQRAGVAGTQPAGAVFFYLVRTSKPTDGRPLTDKFLHWIDWLYPGCGLWHLLGNFGTPLSIDSFEGCPHMFTVFGYRQRIWVRCLGEK